MSSRSSRRSKRRRARRASVPLRPSPASRSGTPGARSTAAWISWKTGRVPAAVHHTLKIGEVCELLPRTAALWAAGEITTPAVEAITAQARTCHSIEEVASAMDEFGAPYVIKDDGLAAGKGVAVTSDRDTALEHAAECFTKPQAAVVVEEFLDGPEVSLFLLADGRTVVPLAPAQDFKRVADDDHGPNTGGMGAYSPLPWAPAGLTEEVVARVAQPVIDYMHSIGNPFSGLLYAGLALTSQGLKVIEFNARFGDPETQVVLARLKTPLAGALYAAATGGLASLPPLEWSTDAAVTVVIASENYPEAPVTGDAIRGLDDAASVEGVQVLHAGTKAVGDEIHTAGGRVLSVTAVGADLTQARRRAYEAISIVYLPKGLMLTFMSYTQPINICVRTILNVLLPSF